MALDPAQKKVALRAINYGLFVLTATDGSEIGAAGVNWLSQASFEPPLIMAAVKDDSGTHALIEKTGKFAVSVLADDQLDVGKAFFRSTSVEGNKINGWEYETDADTGCPLIVACPWWFGARVTDTIRRGDHTVFVAEVVSAGTREEGRNPLLLRSTGMNYGG